MESGLRTDLDCSICTEPIACQSTNDTNQIDDIAALDCCNHVFHFECINTWVQQQAADHQPPKCPLCRRNISVIQAYTFMNISFEGQQDTMN